MKILMLAPNFFEYDKRIKNELQKNGIEVDLYDDFSSYFIDSFIKKFFRKVLKSYLKSIYFWWIYRLIKNQKYDLIFIIKGDEVPEKFLKKVKKEKIKLISYHWDEIERFPKFKKISQYFDKILTYNKYEAKKFGYIYLPFFYSISSEENKKKWDISYVGTYKIERYEILSRLYPNLLANNKRVNINIYINKFKYYLNLFFMKDKFKLFTNRQLNYQETIDIFSNSNAIIEIINKNQTTTTTRSIEAIGLKTKVITTLANIIDYDFYNENNFFILNDSYKVEDLKKWLEIPYKELDKKIKEKYSINNWIKILIKEFEEEI